MRLFLATLIILSSLFGGENVAFHFAKKFATGEDVIILLNSLEGEKKAKLQEYISNFTQLYKSRQILQSEGFRENGTRPGKHFELIGDQQVALQKIVGFSDSTILGVALLNPDQSTITDTIHFQRYEIFYYAGPSGVGWQLQAKFKLSPRSALNDSKSNMNSPLIAFEILKNEWYLSEPPKEYKIPGNVVAFHEKNRNFDLEYWQKLPENVPYMEGFTIQEWISKNQIKPIERLQVINIISDSNTPWWISLSALPHKSAFSKAVVFNSSGSVLNNDCNISGLPINDCFGVLRLESEDSYHEYLVCRKGSWSYGSAISILKPLDMGQFEEVFTYWDVED